eukprot:3768058-Prymnesium_polylepis.1
MRRVWSWAWTVVRARGVPGVAYRRHARCLGHAARRLSDQRREQHEGEREANHTDGRKRGAPRAKPVEHHEEAVGERVGEAEGADGGAVVHVADGVAA